MPSKYSGKTEIWQETGNRHRMKEYERNFPSMQLRRGKDTGTGDRRMKKRLLALALAALLLPCAALGEGYKVAKRNQGTFGRMIIRLLKAYETPSRQDERKMEINVEAISKVRESDGIIARAITDHWKKVYLDPNYALRCLQPGEETAGALEGTALADSAAHAFVVLGYQLQNGEMAEELKARCDAAAAAARSFPQTILVCSGGATGKNNPEKHTEAGLMKDYLVHVCGIDPGRVFTDEAATTTLENAVNTFGILRARGIETITLVTSHYHQRWAQVLYNALSAIQEQSIGYSVALVENYCVEYVGQSYTRYDDRVAMNQLAQMLNLPDEVRESIRSAFK